MENRIERYDRDGLLNLVLVSLISSDRLVNSEECEKALIKLKELEKDFETANIKNKEFYKKFFIDGKEIIERDLENFKKNGR